MERGLPVVEEVEVSEEVTRAHGACFLTVDYQGTSVVEPTAEAVLGILVVGSNTKLESEVFVRWLVAHGELRAFKSSSFHTRDGSVQEDGVIPRHVIAQAAIRLKAFQTGSSAPFFPIHQRSEGGFHLELARTVGHRHADGGRAVHEILRHGAGVGHVVFTSKEVEHAHAVLVGVVVARLTVSHGRWRRDGAERVLPTRNERVVDARRRDVRQEVEVAVFAEDVHSQCCSDCCVGIFRGHRVARSGFATSVTSSNICNSWNGHLTAVTVVRNVH